MNNILQMVEDKQTSEFYPTPKTLIDKMLEGVDLRQVKTILEPSAGKGDILREIAIKGRYHGQQYDFDVDCIEIDTNLRQILQYNFGDRKKDLYKQQESITDKYKYCEKRFGDNWRYYNEALRDYQPVPTTDKLRLEAIDKEFDAFFDNGIHIIHDDFLTYQPFKQYDLIIMNPPFSNGDKHLLKALKIQERGGNIICLLNAETIKNPYTETRRELIKQLQKYNASIEYIEDGFTKAERKTDVEIALIKVAIPEVEDNGDIFEKFQKAENVQEVDVESTDLEVTDYIKAIVARFNVEVKSGIELIKEYKALNRQLNNVRLSLTCNQQEATVNNYLEEVRLKYWEQLLKSEKFVSQLTSELRKDFNRKVNKLADYDFSEFNIYTLVTEMNAQIRTGIEQEILVMFDRLTAEHTWYDNTCKNRHYFDGWKTNKAHKIDKKVILPCRGVYDRYNWRPRTYEAVSTLADIERILNFLDGHLTREVNMQSAINAAFQQRETKNIELKYFKATFYKKGTVHLVFTNPKLIERFNIYVAQQKRWLPPSYGRKTYKNMTEEEKAVVDSFQGEKAYKEVLEQANYYLAPAVGNKTLMIQE